MTARLYLRPVGRIDALPAADSPPEGILAAGRGDLRFAAAEVIERDGDAVRRHLASAAAVAASRDERLLPLVRRLAQPRARIAGLDLARPRIMGIVNVTPDSFSDGGRWFGTETAVAHGLQLAA